MHTQQKIQQGQKNNKSKHPIQQFPAHAIFLPTKGSFSQASYKEATGTVPKL
jgi:hypothetical protein